MHTRRLSTFLLGMWLAGSCFMAFVATQNFRGVDHLLEAPSAPAAKLIQHLGPEQARRLLRHQVSELNRRYFETWELVQLGLGAVLAVVLIFATRASRTALLLCGLMLALTAAQAFLLTPEVVFLGRAIDFVPANVASPERTRFWTFHAAYSSTELIKLFLGALLGVKLLARGGYRVRGWRRTPAAPAAGSSGATT